MSISPNAPLWANTFARPGSGPTWHQVVLGEQLNAGAYGGTAAIHRIVTPGMSHLVAKVFHAQSLAVKRTEKIHAKLAFVAQCSQQLREGYLTSNSRIAPRPHIAWPQALLYSEQQATPDGLVGFIMPVFHGMHPLQLLYTPKHRKSHFPLASADVLLAVAATLAATVDSIHGGEGDSGIVIGDLTPRNILINSQWQLRIIDADSFQYTARGVVHVTNESTPGFRSPNMAGAARGGTSLPKFSRMDDAYALAIVIFHLLVDGAHPWRAGSRFEINGETPDDEDNMLARRFPYAAPDKLHPPRIRLHTYNRLPQEVRNAFMRTFVTGQPHTPAEWAAVLGWARGLAFRPAHTQTRVSAPAV